MTKKLMTAIMFMIMFQGCIAYESVEYKMKIDPKDNSGEIWVTYTGLGTTSTEAEKMDNDFNDIIESFLTGDEFILEALDDGIAIMDRSLVIEDGKLISRYYGIFKDIDKVDENIFRKSSEYFFFLDPWEGEVISTNGNLIETNENLLIVFPDDGSEFIWRQDIPEEENYFSFADRFIEWEKEQESIK